MYFWAPYWQLARHTKVSMIHHNYNFGSMVLEWSLVHHHNCRMESLVHHHSYNFDSLGLGLGRLIHHSYNFGWRGLGQVRHHSCMMESRRIHRSYNFDWTVRGPEPVDYHNCN